MLWFSNGGRDYAPWNGRNVGVLGIEEGRAFSANGFKASVAENALSKTGVPTALKLDPDGSRSAAACGRRIAAAGGLERDRVGGGG